MPSIFITLTGVAIFGGIGSVVRLALSHWHGKLPWGILSGNVLASIVIGATFAAALNAPAEDAVKGVHWIALWTTLLATGLAGGLSTFSSWAAQTVHFFAQKQRTRGYLNFLLNLVLPAAGVIVGMFQATSVLK